MTYIIPDAMALRLEYQRELRRTGRAPVQIQTRNYQTRKQPAPAELVRALTESPFGRGWRDPRLGTGNAGRSTSYLGGLGAADLSPVGDILATMSESMKQKMIESAAINTGITVGLTALGPATLGISAVLAGLYSAVGAIIGSKYHRESEELINNFQDEIKVKTAAADAKIVAVDQQIMKEQEPAARTLAMSNQPLGGLGDLFSNPGEYLQDRLDVIKGYVGDTLHDPFKTIKDLAMRPIKAAQTTVSQVVPVQVLDVYKSVAQPIENTGNRIYNAAEQARDTLTGRAMLTQVEDSINAARATSDKLIADATAKTIAEHQTPAFRNQITVSMAKLIRQDPSVDALRTQHNDPTAPPQFSVPLPSKKLAFLPMAGAAAAVVAFGMFKA